MIFLSFSGCANNSNDELERLRAENEALKESLAAQPENKDISLPVTVATTITTTVPTTTTPVTTTTSVTTVSEPESVWVQRYFVDKWDEIDYNSPYIIPYQKMESFQME